MRNCCLAAVCDSGTDKPVALLCYVMSSIVGIEDIAVVICCLDSFIMICVSVCV